MCVTSAVILRPQKKKGSDCDLIWSNSTSLKQIPNIYVNIHSIIIQLPCSLPQSNFYDLAIRLLLLVATYGTVLARKSTQLPSFNFHHQKSNITHLVSENVHLFSFITFYKLYIYIGRYLQSPPLTLNIKVYKVQRGDTQLEEEERTETTQFPDIF